MLLLDNKSRMRRESHVRICENLELECSILLGLGNVKYCRNSRGLFLGIVVGNIINDLTKRS